MDMKNIVIVGAVAIVLLGALYIYMQPQTDAQPNINITQEEAQTQETRLNDDEARVMDPDSIPEDEAKPVEGKLKADTFTGTLEKVDVGCFADGECYIEVDGKHITVLMGWSRDTVGSVIGADGIGGLEAFIGQEVEVYAQDNSDGTYTLYGSEGFYVKVI